MKLNKLLERQLKKFFPEVHRNDEAFASFIAAVNESYTAYERDIELSERAFRINEEEYVDINKRLKKELTLKSDSIKELQDVLRQTGNNESISSDELADITSYIKALLLKQQEAEKQIVGQRTFYERILNEIPADIAITDKNRRYLFLNPSAIKNPEIRQWMIGKTDEEYRIYRNRSAEEGALRKKVFEDVVASGTRKIWEEKMVTPEGKTEYHLRILYPVFDEQGDFELMIIYGFNITEQRLAEEQTKATQARYKSIFDNSRGLICTHDLNGLITDVNRAATEAFGYDREELLNTSLTALLPKDKQAEFESGYLGEIKTKGKAEGIMVALGKEGKKLYLLYQNFLVQTDTERPYVIGFSQNITERIEAEKALKKSEEKYRKIIANMNLGLMEVDNDETIMYVNGSFCEMSGYEEDELVGKKANDLFIRGENRDIINDKIEKRHHGISDAYELSVKNKRGQVKWWLISGAPIMDDEGKMTGSIGIHLDISQQKMLEKELRQAKADAEHSAHAKETFLANMSHEIRTPMNAIIGLGRILQKTPLNTQQLAYLNSIRNASDNLLVIINDILDLSKIEAGKIEPEHIAFSPRLLINNILAVLTHKATEKGLLLTAGTAPEIADVLIGDPYRINQVLMNLLGNALKFTDRGQISLLLQVTEDNERTQKISFSVSDTGKGMSPEFMARLFDKFTQEDSAVTRKFGGTGLGMSISRQLVELMGGTVEADSQPGRGTTITMTLSFPKGTAADMAEKDSGGVDTRILKGKSILLAEDNEMNRLVATTILQQYGATVAEAENGNIAIEKLQAATYDLILMDMQMPEKGGIETTEYIREHINGSIPIIALTANAIKGEEDKCLAAGMNDFISKPFEEEHMIQLVAKWLGRESSLPPAKAEAAAGHKQLYSLEKIEDIGKGNKDFIEKMVGLFVREMPTALKQMKEALEREDYKTLSAVAHRIKPTLQSLCIDSLREDILVLESAPKQNPTLIPPAMARVNEILDKVIDSLIRHSAATSG